MGIYLLLMIVIAYNYLYLCTYEWNVVGCRFFHAQFTGSGLLKIKNFSGRPLLCFTVKFFFLIVFEYA